jgi:hypothetical protein
MEFTLVRGFVLLIALIGFGASTTTQNHVKAQDDPLPPCLPNSGSCGITN